MMGLDRGDPRPPYQQIAEALRQDIAIGRYVPGDLLPPARKLAEEYGVSKNTVNHAIGLLRAEGLVMGWQGKGVVVRDLLGAVPQGFHAVTLEGPWLTCYEFTHAGEVRYHADVSTITAPSSAEIRARNYPPEPRTEGRAVAFRNEIEARLASRHLIGHWRNTSDTRYFGMLHLAVLPGETGMEGYYTGLASDIAVSTGQWKWVRIAPADGLAAIALKDPRALWELAAAHERDGMPLTLDDIREEG